MSAALRREIVTAARAMAQLGLAPGTSGNVSARLPGGALVTPSGWPWDQLKTAHLVELDQEGRRRGKGLPPTSEWPLHLAVYAARADAGAVVHTHSRFATTLSLLRRDLPASHYMLAVAGGAQVRCARYASYGSHELAEAAVAALEGRQACLLANHGLLALGPTPAAALAVAREVEYCAELHWRALAVGEPVVLDADEIAAVGARLAARAAALSTASRPRRRS
jgi:L-fuculose-phosphate aldolase